MELEKNLLVVIMLIAGFVFSVSFSTLYAQTHIEEGNACSCTLPIPVLIPTFSSLGVFVGSMVYYSMLPLKKESKITKEDFNLLLDMIGPNEKEIVRKIIENKGKITQSKLSSRFGKVKTFRVLEDLKKRGIIEKEPYGKTNIIHLNENLKKLFC